MSANRSYKPITPVVSPTSLLTSSGTGPNRLSRPTWHTLRAAAMLQTSSRWVAEVYAVLGHPVGTLAERVEAYRSYLADTLVRASPLMLDTVSPGEVELALRAMMPPPSWGQRPSTATGWSGAWRSPERILKGAKSRRTPPFGSLTDVDAAFARPFRLEGHVIRCPGHPLGGLGIRPVGDCLEVMLLIRGTLLVSWGNSVRITTPSPLPETVAIAARGRLLSELIDSPLFVGRDYRIRNVTVKGGVSIFTASAPTRACRMSYTEG